MPTRWIAGLALVAAVVAPRAAAAVTPQSREVREVIDRGLTNLETVPNDGRLGGKCLVALALLKAGREATHPRVVEAVESCLAAAQGEAAQIREDIYSTGIAVIFLCAADPHQYREPIEKFLRSLELRQKPHGGWGYPEKPTGDTSMTQYAALAHWEAAKAGVPTSQAAVEKVADWLLRTQDPSGAWGYQGVVSTDGTLVPQSEIRLSLAAAGLGSTLICADLLGAMNMQRPEDEGLPAALKRIPNPEEARARSGAIDSRQIKLAAEAGEHWIEENYKIDPPEFTHYYLYALERAMSFVELAQGKSPKEPSWYNDGFKYLAATQTPEGGWNGRAGGPVDTAFSVLFLLRSTKKSIQQYHPLGEGVLVGGRGLPNNLVDVRLRRGRLVDARATDAAEDLLQILADPTHPDFDYLTETPAALKLSQEPAQRAGQIARLERLARGGAPEARRAAVRALGQSDELEVVPTLIYALSDGDWRVVREARDALQLVSRDFDGFGLPDRPDADQLRAATMQWKAWYRTIRPDLELPNPTD